MGKKRNKKAVIITAIVMFLGILLILTGLFGGRIAGLFTKGFDYKSIDPENPDMNINTNVRVYYYNIDLPDKTLQFLGDLDGEGALIILDLSALSDVDRQYYFSCSGQSITLQGRLRAVDDEEFNEVAESLFRFYAPFYYERGQQEYTLEEYHQLVLEPVIPYCIDVSSIGVFNWGAFIPVGAVIFLVSLIVEICFIFKLKKKIVLPVAFVIMILIPAVMFFGHIRTMLSVKKVTDGLYTMKNYECTDTDGMLGADATSVSGFLQWVFDRHFYGASARFDESNFGFGCSAFAAVTPEGGHLFGRNFDYLETDTLLIYSHPEGAYESIGVTDLGVLGVGQTYPISPDSPTGRLYMTITPYLVYDGMNEKGVAAGILEIDIGETHQDNGKPDLPVYCAIRGILDKCASVEEAMDLLASYDIHSDIGSSCHLFITDRSGRYVVVEWLGGEMVTTEYPYCTNSVIAPGGYYDMGEPDGRLGTMEKCLGSDRVVSGQEAMAVLDEVSVKITEWSCVYNLEDFTVDIVIDGEYGNVYTFGAEDMR